jgi:hypothetical protein
VTPDLVLVEVAFHRLTHGTQRRNGIAIGDVQQLVEHHGPQILLPIPVAIDVNATGTTQILMEPFERFHWFPATCHALNFHVLVMEHAVDYGTHAKNVKLVRPGLVCHHFDAFEALDMEVTLEDCVGWVQLRVDRTSKVNGLRAKRDHSDRTHVLRTHLEALGMQHVAAGPASRLHSEWVLTKGQVQRLR